jgi:hypothetical protein
MNEPTEEELLDAALYAAEQQLPETPDPQRQRRPAQAARRDAPQGPTLAGLAKSRRPQVATVCEACPNSVWFTSPVELRCYCRVMYLVTWSSKEPQQLTACDGVFLV